MVHPAGLEPATLAGSPLLRRRRLPISPRVHNKSPPCYALKVGLTGLPVGIGAARGSRSHATHRVALIRTGLPVAVRHIKAASKWSAARR